MHLRGGEGENFCGIRNGARVITRMVLITFHCFCERNKWVWESEARRRRERKQKYHFHTKRTHTTRQYGVAETVTRFVFMKLLRESSSGMHFKWRVLLFNLNSYNNRCLPLPFIVLISPCFVAINLIKDIKVGSRSESTGSSIQIVLPN